LLHLKTTNSRKSIATKVPLFDQSINSSNVFFASISAAWDGVIVDLSKGSRVLCFAYNT